jgi:hypothetical protein
MSYEKEILFDFNQVIMVRYYLRSDELKLDSWSLYCGNVEIIPDRETADEIEILVANFLEKEYARNVLNYDSDFRESQLEKRYYER